MIFSTGDVGVERAVLVVGGKGAQASTVRSRGTMAAAAPAACGENVDRFNHRRLYEACGDIPPAELEDAYYPQNTGLAEAN